MEHASIRSERCSGGATRFNADLAVVYALNSHIPSSSFSELSQELHLCTVTGGWKVDSSPNSSKPEELRHATGPVAGCTSVSGCIPEAAAVQALLDSWVILG